MPPLVMPRELVAIILVISSTACVSGPFNNTEVPSEGTATSFRGYSTAPSQTVTLLASASPTGPFTPFATATTQTNGYRYPDGLTLYAFETVASVPAQFWSGDACSGLQTYVRVRMPSGIDLPSLDEVAQNGQGSYTCIQNQVNIGWSTLSAISYCSSPDSPNVRLFTAASTGPTTHTGNVSIATAADEKYWSCLESLQGDLTIPAIGSDDLTLPRLQIVNGDVSVGYDRYPIGGSTSEQGSRTLNAPLLTTINGDLSVTSPLPSTGPQWQYGAVLLGLNALTTLQGDLSVQVDAGNMFITGLPSLATVGGNLLLDGGTGDATLGQFAPGLTQVGGDFEVDVGNNIFELLVNLQTVQGDFRHLNGNPSATGATTDAYRSLTTIGGGLTLENGVIQGPGSFYFLPSLTSIAGPFAYRQMAGPSSVQIGKGTGLSVGSFAVENNAALVQVGAGNIQVQTTGAVQIIGNTNLCVSSINAFVANQTGWTGTLTQSGNKPGC